MLFQQKLTRNSLSYMTCGLQFILFILENSSQVLGLLALPVVLSVAIICSIVVVIIVCRKKFHKNQFQPISNAGTVANEHILPVNEFQPISPSRCRPNPLAAELLESIQQ